VEARGTLLIVWLSVEGLALVGLGFLVKERGALYSGLVLLLVCLVMVAVQVFRTLSGMARISSLIVLGLGFIALAYLIIRFKDRLRENL
jgi:hypothetical protein